MIINSCRQYKKNKPKNYEDKNDFNKGYLKYCNKIIINNNYKKSNYLECVDKSLKNYDDNNIKEYDMKIRQIIREYSGIKTEKINFDDTNLKRMNEIDQKTINLKNQRETILTRFQKKNDEIKKNKKKILENIKIDIKEIIIIVQKSINNLNKENKKSNKKDKININDYLKTFKNKDVSLDFIKKIINHYNNSDKKEYFREEIINEKINKNKGKRDLSKILNLVTEEKLDKLLKLNYSYKVIKDKFRKLIVRELMNMEEREKSKNFSKTNNLFNGNLKKKKENDILITDFLK